ncbi:MAG: hypothetical protein FWF86_05220 [Clostridia bacterium]|nr:hypothetical protein [Clostridia bacterium]
MLLAPIAPAIAEDNGAAGILADWLLNGQDYPQNTLPPMGKPQKPLSFGSWLLDGWNSTEPFATPSCMPSPSSQQTAPSITPTPPPVPKPELGPWENAALPQIRNEEELIDFLWYHREKCSTSIKFQINSPLTVNDVKNAAQTMMFPNRTYTHTLTRNSIVTVMMDEPYLAGDRVAYIYRKGQELGMTDEAWRAAAGPENRRPVDHIESDYSLTEDEWAVMIKALDFFEQGYPRNGSALERELSIHDYICSVNSYENPPANHNAAEIPRSAEQQRFKTAAGVLLDGRSNCSGYADAFYLLAKMAGFNVRTVVGDALSGFGDEEWGAHGWNMIELDGAWYYVDVTFDDIDSEPFPFMHAFCNVTGEYLSSTHRWDDTHLPKPDAAALDGFFPYNGVHQPEIYQGDHLQNIARRIAADFNGREERFYVRVKSPKEKDALCQAVQDILRKTYSFTLSSTSVSAGGGIFFCMYIKAR